MIDIILQTISIKEQACLLRNSSTRSIFLEIQTFIGHAKSNGLFFFLYNMKNVTIYFILFIFFFTSFMHHCYFIIIHANTINNSQCLMFAVVIALKNYCNFLYVYCILYIIYITCRYNLFYYFSRLKKMFWEPIALLVTHS